MTPSLVRLEDFVPDRPYAPTAPATPAPPPAPEAGAIDGVLIDPLSFHPDGRGRLVELLTARHGPIEPIVHVYRVFAGPGSVRAWVFHERQADRLTLVEGAFRIALIDLRPESPTHGRVQVVDAGAARPVRLTIPPRVVHGVKNVGEAEASFVNLPTRAWDPTNPDKARLPYDHPGIPFRFE